MPRARLRDLAVLALVPATFPLVALLTGGSSGEAVRNAGRVQEVQAALGLGAEGALVAWTASRPGLAAALAALYVWVHLPATAGALVHLALRRPAAFAPVRDAFLGMHAAVLAVYLAAPTAPPHLAGGSGGGLAGLGSLASHLQSPWAAMPSGHVAWAVIAAWAVHRATRLTAVRAAAWTYPPLVAVLTVATGNHWWADTLAGGALAALAAAASAWRGRLASAVIRRWSPARSRSAPRPRSAIR